VDSRLGFALLSIDACQSMSEGMGGLKIKWWNAVARARIGRSERLVMMGGLPKSKAGPKCWRITTLLALF